MTSPPRDLLGPIDRRTFLRATVGGTSALAVAALLPSGCGGYPSVSGLLTFSAKEFAVLQSLIDTCLPRVDGLVAARDLDLDRYLDRYLAVEPLPIRKQLKQALLLLEYGGFWWGPARRRFTRMDAEAQGEYLRGWLESDSPFRRQVGQTFRQAILNVYYSDERTWDAIEYDGPFVDGEESSLSARGTG